MKRLEHALQVAVAHMLQVVLDPDKTWWTSIDHGVGRLGPAEAGIRKARGVKAGLPDILILYKPPPRRVSPGRVAMNDIRVLGIELKAGKGELSDAQWDVATAWTDLGGALIHVARSLEEVQSILLVRGVPIRTRMNFLGGGYDRSERPATTWHQRPKHRRKPKGGLPVVLARKAQA